MKHSAACMVVAFLLLCGACSRQPYSKEVMPYILAADSVLELQDYYRSLLNNRIFRLRQESERTRTDEERYLVGRMLAECYRNNNADSALAILRRNERLARKMGNERYLVETLLHESHVNAAVSDFNNAYLALRELQTLSLTDLERVAYYTTRIYYYNHLKDFFNRPYRFEVEQYCDSILLMDATPDPDARLWARFWKEFDSYDEPLSEALIEDLRARIDSFGEPDAYWYGNLAWALSTAFTTHGDQANALKYLVLSLTSDLMHSNSDIPSLYGVGFRALLNHDLPRAHRYLKAFLQLQNDFPTRSQNLVLASTWDSLYETTIAENLKRAKRRQAIIFFFVTACLLLLAVAIVLVMRRRHHLGEASRMALKNRELDQSLQDLRSTQEQLSQANRDLHERNERIRLVLAQLAKANQVKEEHIANLFTQCSNYISKMEEQRKVTLRLLKAKKFDDVTRRMTDGELVVADEVQELYKNFDALFLGLFPDFVHDLNALLRPEERISLRTPDTLTNDLRIYALIRLGITSSAQIADVLHLSPQTVYNARTRMRSRATCPPEEFPERVRQLGKFQPAQPAPQAPDKPRTTTDPTPDKD